MKNIRQLHLYLGCVFAPLILYFALSGAWQVFGFHDIPRDGPPPDALHRVLHELSKPHTHNTAPGQDPKTAESTAFGVFALAMGLGLAATTSLGVVIALKQSRSPRTAMICIGVGLVIPVLFLLLR